MNNLTEYFEKYALVSLEKQQKLSRLINEQFADLDLDAGKIRFDKDLEFPFQVLGTESENTLTWLWAWAEEQTEIQQNLMNSSLELKTWGKQHELSEFFTPGIDMDRADGTMLSLIASEVCHASCYYRDQYEGGSLFILLFGETIDRQPSFDVRGMARHVSDLVARYDFNHRNALISYFRIKGLPYSENGPVVTGELATGESIIAEFDEAGGLTMINGNEIG